MSESTGILLSAAEVSIAALDLSDDEQPLADELRRVASAFDAATDVETLASMGPRLLAALEAIGATPRSRAHWKAVACIVCGNRIPIARRRRAGTCSAECVEAHRRELANARKRNREHAERAGVSDITNAQELAMRKAARKCPMPGCGVKLTDDPGLPNSKHLDHILPLNQGGTHTHGNVRITCARCNLSRPKDGSDYSGQLTLWAANPGAVSRRNA